MSSVATDVFIASVRTLPTNKRTINVLSSLVAKLVCRLPIEKQKDIVRMMCTKSQTSDEYELPEMNLRKDIWENFPVVVSAADSEGRHAICWHRDNLREWRQSKPHSYSEWIDYEVIQKYRLMVALSTSLHWTVEDPDSSEQICIIRMKFNARATEDNTSITKSRDNWPVLLCLNDIKAHFPVVWHDESSNIYSIEIHDKKLKAMKGDPALVRDQLMNALTASTAWHVMPAEKDTQFCRIRLRLNCV